jgi:hypothetical protein
VGYVVADSIAELIESRIEETELHPESAAQNRDQPGEQRGSAARADEIVFTSVDVKPIVRELPFEPPYSTNPAMSGINRLLIYSESVIGVMSAAVW